MLRRRRERECRWLRLSNHYNKLLKRGILLADADNWGEREERKKKRRDRSVQEPLVVLWWDSTFHVHNSTMNICPNVATSASNHCSLSRKHSHFFPFPTTTTYPKSLEEALCTKTYTPRASWADLPHYTLLQSAYSPRRRLLLILFSCSACSFFCLSHCTTLSLQSIEHRRLQLKSLSPLLCRPGAGTIELYPCIVAEARYLATEQKDTTSLANKVSCQE